MIWADMPKTSLGGKTPTAYSVRHKPNVTNRHTDYARSMPSARRTRSGKHLAAPRTNRRHMPRAHLSQSDTQRGAADLQLLFGRAATPSPFSQSEQALSRA